MGGAGSGGAGRKSDPARRGGDAWAFLHADGTPLSAYLGWLHWETQQLRAWVRENWWRTEHRAR